MAECYAPDEPSVRNGFGNSLFNSMSCINETECMKKGNLKKYTAWAEKGQEIPTTLHEGTDQPCYVNGAPRPDCEKAVWLIEACDWEEAMAIYHLRQGWDPYKPNSKPVNCPNCGEIFYPKGSGQCWYCNHKG